MLILMIILGLTLISAGTLGLRPDFTQLLFRQKKYCHTCHARLMEEEINRDRHFEDRPA